MIISNISPSDEVGLFFWRRMICFVFFEYKKIAELAKKQVFQKFGFPIEIREIVVADIDEPQTASIYEEIHQPCHNFENYTDYPATYTFENSI